MLIFCDSLDLCENMARFIREATEKADVLNISFILPLFPLLFWNAFNIVEQLEMDLVFHFGEGFTQFMPSAVSFLCAALNCRK